MNQARRATWRGIMMGIAGVLAIQAGFVYIGGFTVRIPVSQAPLVTQSTKRALAHQWPLLRNEAMTGIQPFIRQEVLVLLSQVSIHLGGFRVPLPDPLRSEMAGHLDRVLQMAIVSYWQHHLNPGQLITPRLIAQFLRQPMTVHLWVDVWKIPVPVTVHVGK